MCVRGDRYRHWMLFRACVSIYFFIYLYVCAPAYVYVYSVCAGAQGGQKNGIGSPGIGVASVVSHGMSVPAEP